jgi:hypothetical protein
MENKKSKLNFEKIIVIGIFVFVNTLFIPNIGNNSVSDIGFSRVLTSQMPSTCANYYTYYLCTYCGYGSHYDVSGLPAGGTSNFMCPTSVAMQTCPNYDIGCQCLSGGTSVMMRDPTNTACTMAGL